MLRRFTEDDDYYVPNEFEIKVNELRKILVNSVKQEYMDEINKMRSDVEYMRKQLKQAEQVKQEYLYKLADVEVLQNKYRNLIKELEEN